MSKEQRYIADSGVTPSPITPAQEAFFRWRMAAGSFEYAAQHGSKEDARAHLNEASQRYDVYRDLRDGRLASYPIIAGGSPDLDEPNAPRERPLLQPNELPPELAERLRAEGPYAAVLWG